VYNKAGGIHITNYLLANSICTPRTLNELSCHCTYKTLSTGVIKNYLSVFNAK